MVVEVRTHHWDVQHGRAVWTGLVLAPKRSQVLAERRLARAAEHGQLGRGREPVVAQLEVALAAVEPPATARRLERELYADNEVISSGLKCGSTVIGVPGRWRCACTCLGSLVSFEACC